MVETSLDRHNNDHDVTSYEQINGQDFAGKNCSYLDPITIDFLAFFVAVFLVIEGFVRILEHPNASLKR